MPDPAVRLDPLLLADLIATIHLAIVLFVVLGLPLTWLGAWRNWSWVRSPVFRISHLLTIGFVVLNTWSDAFCPLTDWEWQLRAQAEADPATEDALRRSFVQHWLHAILYVDLPLRALAPIYTGFGLLVLATWWWVPVRWRRTPRVEH